MVRPDVVDADRACDANQPTLDRARATIGWKGKERAKPHVLQQILSSSELAFVRGRFIPKRSPGGGGGGPTGYRSLHLGAFEVIGVCDNGNCSEGNEFVFQTTSFSNVGSNLGSQDVSISGIPGNFFSLGMGNTLLNSIPIATSRTNVYVKETDGWPNNDDSFGDFNWANTSHSLGELRCGVTNQYGTHSCDAGFLWRELNMQLYVVDHP